MIATARPGTPSPSGGLLMRLCFTFGLLFLSPAFVYQLAYNSVTGETTGSWILQVVNLGCLAVAVMAIWLSRDAIDIARRCRPLIVLVVMAFASAAWSYNSVATIRAGVVLLTATLFGVAMAARLSPIACVRLIVRTMVLGCLLSIIWVIVFPETSVHQLTDAYQTQHVGLWRGIFSHKQGLGVFAGVTTGMLFFYGSTAFSSPPLRICAIACGVACLIGTQSVTGFLTMAVLVTFLFATYTIARSRPQSRKVTMIALVAAAATLYTAFSLGLLSFIPELFGKSADLTGRQEAWPYVMAQFKNSGSALFGGGFMSGFGPAVIAPGLSVDNGFIDLLVEFGYLGSLVVFAVYGWIVRGGIRLILKTQATLASTAIFPFNVMVIFLFINISEGNFMSRNISTVLIAVAACQIIRQLHSVKKPAAPQRNAPGIGAKIPRTQAVPVGQTSFRSPIRINDPRIDLAGGSGGDELHQ
jgi:exopolysaccharide production protein ExoQ